jgi:hypothetical protein
MQTSAVLIHQITFETVDREQRIMSKKVTLTSGGSSRDVEGKYEISLL